MEGKEKSTITGLYDTKQGVVLSEDGGANSAEPECPEAEDGNSATLKYFKTSEVASKKLSIFFNEQPCAISLNAHMYDRLDHYCPSCGTAVHGEIYLKFLSGKRCHCPSCGLSFTARTGTFLQGTHMEYRQVFLLAVLIDLMETGITPARIADMVGISADTVRLWIKKFKAFEGHGR